MAELSSIIKEYGLKWLINRSLYSVKLKSLNKVNSTEGFYEKSINEVSNIDLINLNIELLERFYKNLDNNVCEEIIRDADRAIQGKIKAFSHLNLDYGYPINWHMHPQSKIEVPKNNKWFEIPDFDPTRGDIKLIWEISRFTHLYTFLKAYLISHDEKYYKAFSDQIQLWVSNNKYSFGSNYKCGQEATLRMINILFAYSFFEKIGLVTEDDKKNVRIIVRDSYKKVLSNFFYASKCIQNNHTLSEITGLIIGAWCTQDRKALKEAYKLMDKEIANQFLEDGGYKQFSFNYQRFALQLMEFNFMISNVTEIHISNKSKKKIENSIHLINQVIQENGRVPNYGSNDGALIFPFTTCGYLDYRPVINTLNYQLHASKLYEDKNVNEELIWFTGDNPDEVAREASQKGSTSFSEAGLHTVRIKDWLVMLVNNDFSSRPAQMDQNHIDVWYKDHNLFIDTGTYSYANEVGKELSSSKGHNTVQVYNKEMMDKRGPFFIYNWTDRKVLKHSKNHISSGYISKNGYEHLRDVQVENETLNIVDQVNTDTEFCVFFHTPYPITLKDNTLHLIISNDVSFILKTSGRIHIEKTYQSLYYYQKQEISRIVIKKNGNSNKIYTTLEMSI